MNYSNSFLEDCKFETHDGLVGGYPVNHIIRMQNIENKILGGSTEIGISRFENLVIPMGLSSFHGGSDRLKQKKQNINDAGCISDELFEKLFGMVSIKKPSTNIKNTRKQKLVHIKNHSKKNK